MRKADDAVEIDTTDLTPEQVLERALAVIDART
jgi:cytidylate kinase